MNGTILDSKEDLLGRISRIKFALTHLNNLVYQCCNVSNSHSCTGLNSNTGLDFRALRAALFVCGLLDRRKIQLLSRRKSR